MRTDHRAGRGPCRGGFTLIELVVVMTLILALAAITVAFLPKVQESQRASTGADHLQGALLIAKQRALRDQAPRGLRLLALPIYTNVASAVPAGTAPVTVTPARMQGITKGVKWSILRGMNVVVFDSNT